VPLALTISFALVMSFFVSRTVTPLLCLYWMPAGEHVKLRLGKWILRTLDRLDHGYASILRWVLGHRLVVVGSIILFFFASCGLFKQIGTEFFPDSDEGQFQVIYKTPIGTRPEKTEEVGKRLEDVADKTLSEGDRKLYTTFLDDVGLPQGRTALFSPNSGPHSGNLQVNLVPKAERQLSDVAYAEKVRAAYQTAFPGTQIVFFTGGIVK